MTRRQLVGEAHAQGGLANAADPAHHGHQGSLDTTAVVLAPLKTLNGRDQPRLFVGPVHEVPALGGQVACG
jgi:hypothetical protein